jgi:hypothetical protein
MSLFCVDLMCNDPTTDLLNATSQHNARIFLNNAQVSVIFPLLILSLHLNSEDEFFSAVSRHIVGSVCVVYSHCKNMNILMYIQLGKENP